MDSHRVVVLSGSSKEEETSSISNILEKDTFGILALIYIHTQPARPAFDIKSFLDEFICTI